MTEGTLHNGEGKEFLHVICEMENVLLKFKSNIGEYGDNEIKYKIDIMKKCTNSIIEPRYATPILYGSHYNHL